MSGRRNGTPVQGVPLPEHGERYADPAPTVEDRSPSGLLSWLREHAGLVKMAGAMALALGGGYLAYQQGLIRTEYELADRPTVEETRALVEQEIESDLRTHKGAANPHPDIRDQLTDMGTTQRQMRDALLGQGESLRSVVKTLDEVRSELRRMRRRRDR